MKHISLRITIVAACCSIALTSQIAQSMENFFHEHKNIGEIAGAFSPTLGRLMNGEQPAIANNPHKNETAFTRHTYTISEGEKVYRKNRLPIIKAAVEKMLNRSINEHQIPKIALICSGGGYRAMFCTTGSLCGAQEIGLLDATTYITALSGSTWAVAPWISTGLPLRKFKDYLQECAAKPFRDLTHEEKMLIANAIAVKKTYKQPRTLVDPYGDLLANRLLAYFGDMKQMIYLSDQSQSIESGTYPYPIYTAIDGRESITHGQTWYEFTPHTIGERTNNIHIPTWAYGRKFKKGESTNHAPEKNLGYMMGTWGSAFAANIDDIIEEIDKDKDHENLLEKLAQPIDGKRILPFAAKVPNYMYKMQYLSDAKLSSKKHLKFVDSGLEINLPYPPVSSTCPERTPDILIFLDASAGHIGDELKKVAEYAKSKNIPFPSINNELLGKQTISIFKDEDNTATPIVIYMPRISDKELWEANKSKPEFAHYNLSGFDLDYETNNGYCKTQNFQYKPEHSELVMNQTEFNMCINKDAIIKEINWCIDRK